MNSLGNSVVLRPGDDGFSGPPTLEPIPNYISGSSSLETIPNYKPGLDPGVTQLIAKPWNSPDDRGYLKQFIKFGPGEDPGAGYEHWFLKDKQDKIFKNDPANIVMTPVSAETGQQRMAGTNPIISAIVNDLNSSKYT